MNEEDIERTEIEHVFCLTGGELADRPWEPFKPILESQFTEGDCSERETFKYWYEGVPTWVSKSELADRYDSGVTYRTVVENCAFGKPPEIVQDQGCWRRVACFGPSSGECECPWKNVEDDEHDKTLALRDERPCSLCNAGKGESHGFIWIGDGWCEVVYRRFTREVSAEYVDTCFFEYLTDHNNRLGECLLGFLPHNQTLEEGAQELLEELILQDIPEDLTDEQLLAVLRDALSYVDLSRSDETSEGEDEDSPMVWVVLKWTVDVGQLIHKFKDQNKG